MVGTLTVQLHLPGCKSLKEKRGLLQPLMARLRREFNVSVAEVGLQDMHQQAMILCAMVNSDSRHLQRSLQRMSQWVQGNWPDGDVIQERIELL